MVCIRGRVLVSCQWFTHRSVVVGALCNSALNELVSWTNFLTIKVLNGLDQRSKTFQRHIWVFKRVSGLPVGESLGEGLALHAVTNKKENIGEVEEFR